MKHFVAILFFALAILLPAQVTHHNGLSFDPARQEVLADDGITVLDRGSFRVFPTLPTERGVKRFSKWFERTGNRGFEVRTRIANGVMLADVYGRGEFDRGIEPLAKGWRIGDYIDAWLRHGKSDQYVIQQIKLALNSPSR